jgi:hypothetical protein
METKMQIEITPMWSVIAEVKEKIRIFMEGMSQGNIDFTIIVASELLENAIKYGIANDKIGSVGFVFEIAGKSVLVKVSNGVNDNENLEKFKAVMEKIKTTENKEGLYIARLLEIMDDPSKPGSSLGLYRIVSESKFELEYELDNHVLSMIATREFKEN